MAQNKNRRVIIDSDTAGDDTQAILMAALSERITLEGVTVVAGNVDFDSEVENAKYTLDVAGRASDIQVYEGARTPLLKDHKTVEHIHGEGGLGGELQADTEIPSADEHAVDYIVRMARENPGEITLLCIGPLTNIALALQREPNLDELVEDVWFMGGNANDIGNITPASSYNVWVDPDAAKIAIREMHMTTVGVEVCYTRRKDSYLYAEDLERVEDACDESQYADFYMNTVPLNRDTSVKRYGIEGTTHPDTLTISTMIEPKVIEEAGTHFMDIDEREGMTRGYSLVDEYGETDGEPKTRVVKKANHELFKQMLMDMLLYGEPERSL